MRSKTDPLKTLGLLLIVVFASLLSCVQKPTEPEKPKAEEKVEPATARIVFLAQGENDSTHIYIIDDNGENLQKLYSYHDRMEDIQVSPAGDRAAFFADLGSPPIVADLQLFLISLKTWQVSQLTDLSTGICWEPQWIPNSDEICFVFDSYLFRIQLFAVRTDGTGLRRITSDDSVSHRLPKVSPDGNKVICEKRLSPKRKIAVINPDAASEKIIFSTSSDDQYSQWSSTGDKIVFIGDSKLCVMDSSGENYKTLHSASRGLIPFDVSPQSNIIVFNSYSGIQKINIDGSGLQLLTEKRAQGSPVLWSHDESKIAFITDLDDDDQNEICTIKADGTDLKRVTPNSIAIIEDFGLKIFDWAPLNQ